MELCDKYLHELILLNPPMNDYLKLDEYNHLRGRFPNFLTEEYTKKEDKLNKKYYNLLKKKKNKTFYDQLVYKDLKDYFKVSYFEDQYFPLSNSDNIYMNFIFDIKSSDSDYEFTDKQSYQDFISRMKTLTPITTIILRDLKEGLKKKITISGRIVRSLINQMTESIQRNTYQNKFNHYRKIPNSIQKEFLDSIEKYIIRNIGKILKFLSEDYIQGCTNKIGLCSIKNGKKYYRDNIKLYTYKDYTPEKIHQIGLSEIKKYVSKIEKLKRDLKVKGSYNEFIHLMKNHKSSKTKDVINELKKIRKRILKDFFPKYFDGEIEEKDYYKIKKVTKEEKHTSAYYLLPDFRNKREGTFFINSLNSTQINKHELAVLSIHEGIPGHHYENYLLRKSDKPMYYKTSDYTAYSEGWALYCEGLFEPLNHFEYFWQLIYNLHRCVRLVLDTGIHYFHWTYERSFQYMKQYLPFDDEYIKNEIERYISDPGQAVTYKIGELLILELRKEYFKKKRGDYKGFHHLILKIGPCPLHILKQKFNQ